MKPLKKENETEEIKGWCKDWSLQNITVFMAIGIATALLTYMIYNAVI